MALSYRQRIFVEKYIGEAGFNAAEAVRLAGYKCKDPAARGSKLLSNPEVKALVDARVAEMAMSANEILVRLTEHARGSMEDFLAIRDDGTAAIDFVKAQRAGKLHLLKKYTDSDRYGVEIQLHDAQSALQLLGRAHGIFVDKTALTDPSGENAYDAFAGIKEQLLRRLDRLAAAGDAPAVSGEPES